VDLALLGGEEGRGDSFCFGRGDIFYLEWEEKPPLDLCDIYRWLLWLDIYMPDFPPETSAGFIELCIISTYGL
jgi:hypothetical protein